MHHALRKGDIVLRRCFGDIARSPELALLFAQTKAALPNSILPISIYTFNRSVNFGK